MIRPAACRQLKTPWRFTSTTADQLLPRQVDERTVPRDAGVVDEEVEARRARSTTAASVEPTCARSQTSICRYAMPVAGASGETTSRRHDLPAVVAEALADREAQPARASGDDRDAARCHVDAAVDVVGLAGDHARIVACEEDDHRCDVLGLEAPADGGQRPLVLLEVVAEALRVVDDPRVVHARPDGPGVDAVDGDPLAGDLERQRPHQADDAVLARHVRTECGDGTRPLIDAIVMILPQRCARMCGSAAFERTYGAVRFTSSVSSQNASLYSAIGRGSALLPMPALLTRMSIGPKTAAARSTSALDCARSARSEGTAAASPPAAAIADDDGVELVDRAGRCDHARAVRGERERRRASDPASGARHQCDPACALGHGCVGA